MCHMLCLCVFDMWTTSASYTTLMRNEVESLYHALLSDLSQFFFCFSSGYPLYSILSLDYYCYIYIYMCVWKLQTFLPYLFITTILILLSCHTHIIVHIHIHIYGICTFIAIWMSRWIHLLNKAIDDRSQIREVVVYFEYVREREREKGKRLHIIHISVPFFLSSLSLFPSLHNIIIYYIGEMYK